MDASCFDRLLGERFGHSVAPAGDVNGDGLADVIIAAPGCPGGTCQCKIYVYHASPSGLSTSPDWTVTGENAWDYLGYSAHGELTGMV